MKKFTELELAKNLVYYFILPRLEIMNSFRICRYVHGKFVINISIKHDADNKRFILSDRAKTQEILFKVGYKNTLVNTEKLLDIIGKYHLQGRTNRDGASEIAAVISYKTKTEFIDRSLNIALKIMDLINAIIEIFETFAITENKNENQPRSD